MLDLLILCGLGVVVGLVLRVVFKRKEAGMTEASRDAASSGPMATRQPAARPSAGDTYSALLGRYRPAYVAATNIATGGVVFAIAGVIAVIWGATQFDAGGLSRSLAPLLVGGGFFSVVVGLSLSMLASILRAVLDRTAFTAPGLDDAERVRLAFEAGGQSAPRGRAPSRGDG